MNRDELKQRLIELLDGMPWRIEQDFGGVRISNGSKCSDYLIANGVTIRDRGDTADIVEVVRCRDCTHRNPFGYMCLRDNLWHDTDDFCSYGERKPPERSDAE